VIAQQAGKYQIKRKQPVYYFFENTALKKLSSKKD
jgi:hypothetical protein